MSKGDKTIYIIAALIAFLGLCMSVVATLPGKAPSASESANEQAASLDLPPVPADADTDPTPYAVLSERPLFVAGRHPYEGVSAPAAVAGEGVPGITLLGVIISNGRKIALIRQDAEAKVSTVQEGESVAGWQVEVIRSDAIVLKSGAVEQVVALPVKSQGTGEAPAASASPAGE
jgi:hypothetical protein